MIISKIVKIAYTNDNSVIEDELKKINIEPIRWAIVAVNDNELTLCVSMLSFENKRQYFVKK